ncbi:MAG: ComF family protein, partial [Isosphaeraceae bacterium]
MGALGIANKPAEERSGWLRRQWSRGQGALTALVLPCDCPICGAEDDGRPWPFCEDCRGELLDAAGRCCARCAMTVGPFGACRECRGRSFGFDRAIALGPYQGPLRALCLMLKHEPNAWLGPWLARLLIQARPALRDEAAEDPQALITPIPLHWRRWWSRGYNQSDELTRALAVPLGLRRARLLRRVRSTPKLAGLGRVERARVLRDAFRVRRPWSNRLKGRTVFLVDDILTSGATCGAAA